MSSSQAFRAVDDESWAPVARSTREAMALLGYRITTRCLPDEPEHCGGSYAEHAAAHLASIKALVDHQLQHLGAPERVVTEIYEKITAELAHVS